MKKAIALKARVSVKAPKTMKNDPAVALWRKMVEASSVYDALQVDICRLVDQLPKDLLASRAVQFEGKSLFSIRSIEEMKDEALRRADLTPDQRSTIEAKAAQAIVQFQVGRAACAAAHKVIGLTALERKSTVAEKALDRAEDAVVAYGLKSPASILAGLHRIWRSAHSDSLSEYAFETLRAMAEPLLSTVPADLAAKFREDWPASAGAK